jgi:protein-tyrosine-phosphatase
MDVVKFKKTGDVYFVQYEENEDIKTLKTEDEPESELSVAMDNVALASLKLFKIRDVGCKLQAIEWKDGEKAGSKCILLSGESQFGQFKMALPKVSTQDAETTEEGIYDPGETKNQYNQTADHLRDEVKRFVEGARRQRVLPFNDESGDGKKKKGILRAVADKAAGLFG